MPLVVIVGLALGHANEHRHHSSAAASPSALPPVTVAAPPSNPTAIAPCTKVLTRLPTSLDGLQSRPAFSTSSLVVAWGDPAVVLRCGVNRPAGLVPGSDAFTTGIDGVFFWVVHAKDATVFTVIDRSVYVEVTVPSPYAGGPLAPIADAVRAALPAVCVVSATETDPAKLCTHRP